MCRCAMSSMLKDNHRIAPRHVHRSTLHDLLQLNPPRLQIAHVIYTKRRGELDDSYTIACKIIRRYTWLYGIMDWFHRDE